MDFTKENIFFLSGFSFTDTDDWQDSEGREGKDFYYMRFTILINLDFGNLDSGI